MIRQGNKTNNRQEVIPKTIRPPQFRSKIKFPLGIKEINPKRAGIFGQSKSRGGRNPPAVVFVLLYGQFPCKPFIKGSQMKADIFIYM